MASWKGDNLIGLPVVEQKPAVPTSHGDVPKGNLAEDVRRDKDTQQNYSIKLKDIDTAIFEHLNNYIAPHVLDAGNKVKVPILYMSPEKWKSAQKDGYIRDGQGKLQLPVFAFGRTGFGKNQDLQTVNRYLTVPVVNNFTEANKYNPRSIFHKWDRGNTKQVFGVTLPDHITVT